MAATTDIILFGLGALGSRLLRVLQNDYPLIRVVGVVDRDPDKAGKTVTEVSTWTRFGDLVVAPDLESCLAGLDAKPTVLVHMTESKPAEIEGQLIDALGRGLNVLSAAESMFYPGLRFPDFTDRLDAEAKRHGVTISGCGINPGFVYDVVPILLARATSGVSEIKIHRCIDVTGTGPGDIEHVGYGLTPEAFRARLADGSIVGHMGAPESLALMAEHLDLPLDLIEEGWDVETAEFEVDSGDPTLGILPPGRVIGITQTATGLAEGRAVISTKLAMYYQPERFGLEEADTVEITGAMPIRMAIRPALESLFGAANVVANAIVDVAAAPAGLVNILDLPLAASRRAPHRYRIDPARQTSPGTVSIRAVSG